MDFEMRNDGRSEESQKHEPSGVEDQCKAWTNDSDGNSKQKLNCGGDTPWQDSDFGVGLTSVNQDGELKDFEEPIMIVTPEGQRRSWLLEVSQSADDSPESIMSLNSECNSDVESWTLEDGPEATLRSYENQIKDMASENEALRARAIYAEKELSRKDKLHEAQLKDAHLKHAEFIKAQEKEWKSERSEAWSIRRELLSDHDHLEVQYREAALQIQRQAQKIKDLEAKILEYANILNKAKAPDGSILSIEERETRIEKLRREVSSEKFWYTSQIRALEGRLVTERRCHEKITQQARELLNKANNVAAELANERTSSNQVKEELKKAEAFAVKNFKAFLAEQRKFKDSESKVESERKKHQDAEEASQRNFEAQLTEAQASLRCRDEQIEQWKVVAEDLHNELAETQLDLQGIRKNLKQIQESYIFIRKQNETLQKRQCDHDEKNTKDHKSTCENHIRNEDSLKKELDMLKTRLKAAGATHIKECKAWKSLFDAMRVQNDKLTEANATLEKARLQERATIAGSLDTFTEAHELWNTTDTEAGSNPEVPTRTVDANNNFASDKSQCKSKLLTIEEQLIELIQRALWNMKLSDLGQHQGHVKKKTLLLKRQLRSLDHWYDELVEVIIFNDRDATDIERLNIPKKLQDLNARIAITGRELVSVQNSIRSQSDPWGSKYSPLFKKIEVGNSKNMVRQPPTKVAQDEPRTDGPEMGRSGKEHMANQTKTG